MFLFILIFFLKRRLRATRFISLIGTMKQEVLLKLLGLIFFFVITLTEINSVSFLFWFPGQRKLFFPNIFTSSRIPEALKGEKSINGESILYGFFILQVFVTRLFALLEPKQVELTALAAVMQVVAVLYHMFVLGSSIEVSPRIQGRGVSIFFEQLYVAAALLLSVVLGLQVVLLSNEAEPLNQLTMKNRESDPEKLRKLKAQFEEFKKRQSEISDPWEAGVLRNSSKKKL